MGRHADPDPRHFWGSLAAAAGKALLALVVVTGVFLGASRIGQPPGDGPALLGSPEESPGDVSGEDPDADRTPSPDADTDRAPPARGTSPRPTDTDEDTMAQAEVVTVQVLDATGSGLGPDVAEALAELGYEVVTVGEAARRYERTTVLWSEGYEQAARELRAADRRFGVLEENDRLNPEVNLHVVVGADWPAASASGGRRLR